MKVHDRRGDAERRVRAAWQQGEPGAGLRLAALLFGAAADARALAYDCGLAAARRAPLPVLSVGGLTVGGSGKTPVAAAAAEGLRDRGVRTAVVTRGFTDELAVHRRLAGGGPVLGAVDRMEALRAAADRGAGAAVLDDGFQHRRAGRDLDWVVVSAAELSLRPWRRLPAGPARDRWGELSRADSVVLTARSPVGERRAKEAAGRVARQFPSVGLARCVLRRRGLEPLNRAAREASRVEPRVAFASVMRGGEFLDRLDRTQAGLREAYLFPDHHAIDEQTLSEMADAAAGGGIVGTLKDGVKVVGRLPPGVPLWYVDEEVQLVSGGRVLDGQLDRIAAAAASGGRA